MLKFVLPFVLTLLCSCSSIFNINRVTMVSVGDVVILKFQQSPEFNQVVVVDRNRKISLDGVGKIDVTGLTVSQLKAIIRIKYYTIALQSDLDIFVKKSTNFKIYFGGKVANPGLLKYNGRLTVAQAIALVGGTKTLSRQYRVVVFRLRGRKIKIYKINSSQLDFVLLPYDIVYVLEKAKPDKWI